MAATQRILAEVPMVARAGAVFKGMADQAQVNYFSLSAEFSNCSNSAWLAAIVFATIDNGDDFRVYRRKEGDRKGPCAWRQLRRGIADLHRRAQLSHKAAARYLDAFATVDDSTTLDQLLQRLEQPRQWRGRRIRASAP